AQVLPCDCCLSWPPRWLRRETARAMASMGPCATYGRCVHFDGKGVSNSRQLPIYQHSRVRVRIGDRTHRCALIQRVEYPGAIQRHIGDGALLLIHKILKCECCCRRAHTLVSCLETARHSPE